MSAILLLYIIASLLLSLIQCHVVRAEVIVEIPKRSRDYDVYSGILKRIDDRLDMFMSTPEQAVSLLETYHKNQGFRPHGLHATGRDRVLSFLYSLSESFDGLNVYFGTEQGEYFTYFPTEGVYREPGNSGYRLDDPVMQKYWPVCVKGEDGSQENCQMKEGDSFIQCVEDCQLEVCPDEISQTACQIPEWNVTDRQRTSQSCEDTIKWCPSYTIEQVGPAALENGTDDGRRGYVPTSYHCIDESGMFSQTPGIVRALSSDESQTFSNGTCSHWDGSPVTRVTVGPFASCQEYGGDDDNESCNTTYVGVIRTVDYDRRLRPWYITTREQQSPNWSPPYPFHSFGQGSIRHIGITFASPYYSIQRSEKNTTRHVFEGVFAVDYSLQDISTYLMNDFGNVDDMVVVLFEQAEPYYVVGISTETNSGSSPSSRSSKIYRSVKSSDPSVLCTPADKEEDCELTRVPATDFRTGDNLDDIVSRAAQAQADAGFPARERVIVKDPNGSGSYISQSYKFEQGGLKWVILLAAPIQRVSVDRLEQGSTAFIILIIIATVGTLGSSVLFGMWYRNRDRPSVKCGDFPFTCAFLLGCILLNLSSFLSLGENTDEMCMVRMWSFNFCLSLMIAPLFAKVFRVYILLGGANRMRRVTMNHKQTALRTLPIILFQLAILVVFTIVDPPAAEESVTTDSGVPQQSIQCHYETHAFTITQVLYNSFLVVLGCYLCFLSRNLDVRYGEARQLFYGVYNIAITGVVFVLLLVFADAAPAALHTFRAVSVCWGTLLTGAVFVLPRVFQTTTANSSSLMNISGLSAPDSNSACLPAAPFERPVKTQLEEIQDLDSCAIILNSDSLTNKDETQLSEESRKSPDEKKDSDSFRMVLSGVSKLTRYG